MSSRIDNFYGTESQYVAFLEQALLALRQHHAACHRSAQDTSAAFQSQAEAGSTPFEVVIWNPQPTEASQSTLKHWESSARALIKSTPKAQDWWDKVQEVGIYETMRSGNLANILLDGSLEITPVSTTSTLDIVERDTRHDVVIILQKLRVYAQTTANRETNALLTIMLANFQKFLLMTACAVLYDLGVSRQPIFEVVKVCVGNQVTDDYCSRILRTAKHLNRLIDTLYANGWNNRASELLLIWNRPLASYISLSSSPGKSLDYLSKELCRGQFASDVPKTDYWTPLFVPSLVESILLKKIQS